MSAKSPDAAVREKLIIHFPEMLEVGHPSTCCLARKSTADSGTRFGKDVEFRPYLP